MVIVGKHINNVTINPLEYLLDDDGKVMKFINEDAAKAFLKEKGLSDDDIYGLVFETVSASNMTKELLNNNLRNNLLSFMIQNIIPVFKRGKVCQRD